MYAVTSVPLVRRTRAIFRRAEFGFLGVMVRTWTHTPRRCGEPTAAQVTRFFSVFWRQWSAGALLLALTGFRPFRIS
jgi:hypothetical protein